MSDLLDLVDSITDRKLRDISIEEWFRNNPFSIQVFKSKYALNDRETPPQMLLRVCEYAAQAEDEAVREYWTKRWFLELVDDWWLPGGSILSGAGNSEYKCSLMNCTSVEVNEDSLEAIGNLRYTISKMAAYRQGVGINFSKVRPKGFIIKNSSRISSGATHWMRSFDRVGDEVGQSGRVPALLISLNSEHPDIEEFIDLKAKSVDDIRNCNISIMATDRFMEAAKKKERLTLSFTSVNETKTKDVYPHKLIRKSAENIASNGEPGYQFIDTIKRWSNSDYVGFPVVGSNACLVNNCYLYTDRGIKRIKDLFGADPLYVFGDSRFKHSSKKYITDPKLGDSTCGLYTTTPIFSTGKRACSRVLFSNGLYLDVSDDHEFPVIKDTSRKTYNKKKTLDLKKGDRLFSLDREGGWPPNELNDYHKGILWGICKTIHSYKDSLVFPLSMTEPFETILKEFSILYQPSTSERGALLRCRNLPAVDLKSIPSKSRELIIGFLRALFTLNGKTIFFGTPPFLYLRVDIPSDELCQIVNLLLLNFGIVAEKYEDKFLYLKGVSLSKFISEVGIFGGCLKIVEKYISSDISTLEIEKITSIGEHETYCLTQPVTNTIVVNGIVTYQCSEQMLDDHGVCLLGSVNMGRFNHVTLTNDLYKVSESILRFLDDINTMEIKDKRYVTEKQKVSMESLRRVGCGITNISEYLLKTGSDIKDKEGQDIIEEFMSKYSYFLYHHSQSLGREKGSFLAFKREDFIQAPFVKRMQEYNFLFSHMRNCTLISIAPTGSVSTQFRNFVCSYGAEPSFGKYYWKRTRVGGKWEYYFNVPYVVQEYMKLIGKDLNMKSCTIKDDFEGNIGKPIKAKIDNYCSLNMATTSDFSIKERLDLLALLYKYTDASLSVTNLITTETVDDVEEIIYDAYDRGLKCFTCFPNKGNRLGIIENIPFRDRVLELIEAGETLSKNDLSEKEMDNLGLFYQRQEVPLVRKRPRIIDAHVYKISAKGEPYYIFVGLLDRSPYEIFLYKIDSSESIPDSKRKGQIIKTKSGTYKYKSGDFEIENIARYETGLEILTARFVSMALRNNARIDFIVKQLKKSQEYIGDFCGAIIRVLRKYDVSSVIEDGAMCPNCKSMSLVKSEGCTVCKQCGYGGSCG